MFQMILSWICRCLVFFPVVKPPEMVNHRIFEIILGLLSKSKSWRDACRMKRDGPKYLISSPTKPLIPRVFNIIEGSLEVKLPTIWTDEKQRWEESEKRREEERRSKKRKSQKKEDPGVRKGRKVATHSKLAGSEHFWKFRCRFAWQAQGIVHLVKSKQKT